MIYIGVDPGLKGGYAWIWDDTVRVKPWNDVWFAQDMKMLSLCADKPIACVEKVGAMPGQGVSSMFTFGKGAGYIEGVLVANGIPYQLVPPVKWKKEFSLIGTEKRASIEVAKKLLPGVEFFPTERSRVESDGMADAALLSLFAKRNF